MSSITDCNSTVLGRGGFLSGYPINTGAKNTEIKKIPGDKNTEIKKNPESPRFFGIFLLGFFRDFQIPIPIPGIPRFSGFSDLAQNKKSRSRSQLWY